MYEGPPRHGAETEYRRRHESPIIRRPDRIALWAVGMAIVAMVAAAASAHAGSGGTGTTDGKGSCAEASFGSRALSLGDCGTDVKTLHWIMKADSYGVGLDNEFDDSTKGEVEDFQRRHDLRRSGVVRKRTRKELVHTMGKSTATWYGPGFWHHKTACGKTLRRRTVGVAHRHLPCGTKVTLKYGHRFVTTRVIDRGPYTRGVHWDLTKRAAKRLHFTYTDDIRVAAIKK
jgi:rare lipoprotein A (peptidoglycan hydrolase)